MAIAYEKLKSTTITHTALKQEKAYETEVC